jgi:hypothetical protein
VAGRWFFGGGTALDAVHREWLRPTAKLHLTDQLDVEIVADERARGTPQEDLSRGGFLL